MSWDFDIVVIAPGFEYRTTAGLADFLRLETKTNPFREILSCSSPQGTWGISSTPERVIIVDDHCLLHGAPWAMILESGQRRAVFSRISDANVCRVFDRGQEMSGVVVCKHFLNTKVTPPPKNLNGELLAWLFPRQSAGLDLHGAKVRNLNDSAYRVFGP